ncbi:MAG TPA: META domain-containing protein [Chitinophagaceae bacterium]
MRNIFFFIVFGVAIISCHTSKVSSVKNVVEKENPRALNGSWKLQMLFASDNNWTNAPHININLKDKTFSGNGACNALSGKFIINESYFAFDKNIISTKMACADPKANQYEKSFLSVLLKINRYTLNKDELELGQGEIVLMKFTRSY